jgi:hypothetical protein
MLEIGMKNEIVPIRFRPRGISGSIHFSRTGLVSFVITSLDTEIFCGGLEQTRKSLATNDELSTPVYSGKEWY